MQRLLLITLLTLIASTGLSAVNPDSERQSRKGFVGETPLMEAVRVGDAKQVSAVLKSGIDVNDRNAGGVTALMLAAADGRTDLVELLLDAGARPDITDYDGASAADRATLKGHTKLGRRLKALSTGVDKSKQVSGYDFADDAVVDVKHPDWFKKSFLDFRVDLEEAQAAGKQGIMLFISTRRCSYCKVFLDRVLADPEIRRRVQSSYDVIGLEIFSDFEMTDVDGQEYRVNEFVTMVKASFTPTLIFYKPGEQRVLKIVGYYPKDKFTRVLDYLDEDLYRKEPLRDYLKRTEPQSPATTKMIIDRELFRQSPQILDRRAARAQQPLLVVFESDNCEACIRLHERVLSDQSIRNLISQFEAVQLNITNSSGRIITPEGERISPLQWYRNLELSYSPSIVFFDESGQEVMRLDSETLRYRMEGTLQLVLEKAYENDAQLQRWRRGKAIEALQK